MYNDWEKKSEDTIKRLKDELYLARRTILGLMPENLRRLLLSYYNCESRKDTPIWENDVIENLLEHASIIPFNPEWERERAYCPLCGSGSNSAYEKGYAYPEGLRRHFTGYGRTQQCPVFEQVFRLALDHWNDKFADQERREREEAAAIMKARREQELLYLVKPNSHPKLKDEGIYPKEDCRDDEGFEWAESRLFDIGFEKIVADRVVSYVFSNGEMCVYANPLQKGRISFCACKKSAQRRSNARLHWFDMQDRLKKDLKSVFAKHIVEAKSALKIP